MCLEKKAKKINLARSTIFAREFQAVQQLQKAVELVDCWSKEGKAKKEKQ